MLNCKPSCDSRDIVASISGTLTQSEYKEFVAAIELQCNAFGAARLLLDIREIVPTSDSFFWQNIQFALSHLTFESRVAVIGQGSYRSKFDQLIAPLANCESQFFCWIDLTHACAWLVPETASGYWENTMACTTVETV